MPSELGRWDLSRVCLAEFEGHLRGASLSHRGGVSATFDEPNLVSCAGLVPVLPLAERAVLHRC